MHKLSPQTFTEKMHICAFQQKCSACTKTRHRAHGAPIQCTRGKCPRAFHVSCARDGAEHHIVYNIVREVEKEVVLIDSSPMPPAAPHPMNVYPSGVHSMAEGGYGMPMGAAPPMASLPMPMEYRQPTPEPRVLRNIKKLEVEVLCSQHNPVCLVLSPSSVKSQLIDYLQGHC